MSAISNYLETKLIDLVFRATAYTSPQTWIALFTSNPGEDASGTEVTGGSYARKRVFNDGATSPYWSASSNGAVENVQAVTFAQATASWGTITHVGIFDASTAGNLLYYGALASSKTINLGDTAEFAAGDLDVSIA